MQLFQAVRGLFVRERGYSFKRMGNRPVQIHHSGVSSPRVMILSDS